MRRRAHVTWWAVGVVVVFCLMVYTRPFGEGVLAQAASVLPFPVERVNGGIVWYREAFQKQEGLLSFYAAEGKDVGGQGLFHEQLFASLARERMIRQLLRSRDLNVSRGELDSALHEAEERAGGTDALAKEVKDHYGWNVKQFRKLVLRSFVETRMLETALLEDETLQAEKRARIEEAERKLEEGAEFDGMVLEYSEDATSVFNGDQGWISESALPPEWKAPALKLEIGAFSPVIEERGRFVILRVDDREMGEGVGVIGGVPSVPSNVEGAPRPEERSNRSIGLGSEPDPVSGPPAERDPALRDRPLVSSRVNLSAIIVNKISLAETLESFAETSKVSVYVKL